MKHLMTLLALYVAAVSTSAFAADAPVSKVNKMRACGAEAGERKGDDRKSFMHACMNRSASADTSVSKVSKVDKMRACNADAGDKQGDDRKAFMHVCMSAKNQPSKTR